MSATVCWGRTNRDCILYPGKGTVVRAQTFYERINVDFLSDIAVEQEDALHSGLACPGAYHAAVGAAPQEKAHRIQDDGLAGPSLPGQVMPTPFQAGLW